MISLKNILFATTKAVAENFPQDVYIEDNNTQGFDKSCFFVQICYNIDKGIHNYTCRY